MNMENEKEYYLEGFKDGMEAGLKISWAYANELLISVNNDEKEKVREYIKKLTH